MGGLDASCWGPAPFLLGPPFCHLPRGRAGWMRRRWRIAPVLSNCAKLAICQDVEVLFRMIRGRPGLEHVSPAGCRKMIAIEGLHEGVAQELGQHARSLVG